MSRILQSRHYLATETHPGVWTITEKGTSRRVREVWFVDEDEARRDLDYLEKHRAAENQTDLFE